MARGSRYGVNRLVGPDKIDQLMYVDIAKSQLYTGDVHPVPDFVLTTANDTEAVGGVTLVSLGIEVGDILKINNVTTYGTAAQLFYIEFSDVAIPNDGATQKPDATSSGRVVEVPPETTAYIVVPPFLRLRTNNSGGGFPRMEVIRPN